MPRRPSAHPTTAYAEAGAEGRIVVGEFVRLACERHLRDLSRRDLRFDLEAADRGLSFFPRLLSFTKGERAGEPFALEPWQSFIVGSLLGWKRGQVRRFRQALVLVGKKAGKSELAGGLALYGLVADREAGADIYSAATTRDQATLVWRAALAMRNANPQLRGFIGASSRRDTNGKETGGMWIKAQAGVHGGGSFQPLGRDKDSTDGINPHWVIVDELHRHKSRDLFDVLVNSTSARRQPLVLSISTAGTEAAGVCFEERESAIKVLRGVVEQDELFAYMAEIDAKDDWRDERAWPKANPNLGVSITIERLREECVAAQASASKEAAFVRYRCNRWAPEPGESFLDARIWDGCGGEVVREGPLFVGVDVSARTDWCAIALYWPETGGCDWRFFLPEEGVAEKTERDRVPVQAWADAGLVTLCQGPVVDLRDIRAAISGVYDGQEVGGGLAEEFDLAEVAIDPWGATQLLRDLGEDGDGLTVVPFRQGFQSMSPAFREFEALATTGALAHGGNPVAAWMLSNTRVLRDSADNIKPVKMDGKRGRRRIDGIVALGMAIGRATIVGDGEGSVYDTRGPLRIPA